MLGAIAWLIQVYTPIPQPIKTIITLAICLVLLLILVRTFVGDIPLRGTR